ncbi:MAG: DUF3810 domain-containing protein [Lachnospiraceae bacterium]
MKKYKNLWSVIVSVVMLALAVSLTLLSRKNGNFAEYYAIHIYPYFSSIFSHISNLFAWSLIEILLIVLIVVYVICFTQGIICLVKKKKTWKIVIGSWARKNLLLFSTLLLIYVLNCGINYQRQTFSTVSGFTIEKHTNEELEALCRWLAEQVNESAQFIERDENGSIDLDENCGEEAVAAMKKLGETYPDLQGYYPNPKPIAFSFIWSYQYICGIYSPFTVEANYNREIPLREIPFTMCHELSHLRGFMREDEANFIAYLACRDSEIPSFVYSGYMGAFSYAMDKLYDSCGADCYWDIYNTLDEEVVAERQAGSAWWNEHKTVIKEVAHKVNDTYLKANSQTDGTKSYGRMVDLLLKDFLQRKL